jgi:hypothetical protein
MKIAAAVREEPVRCERLLKSGRADLQQHDCFAILLIAAVEESFQAAVLSEEYDLNVNVLKILAAAMLCLRMGLQSCKSSRRQGKTIYQAIPQFVPHKTQQYLSAVSKGLIEPGRTPGRHFHLLYPSKVIPAGLCQFQRI